MLTLACQSKSFECDIYLHSEKDFLQMTCKALHFSNLLLQLISECDVLTLKTMQSHTLIQTFKPSDVNYFSSLVLSGLSAHAMAW